MTPEDYRRAGELFDKVSELADSEREAALDAGCAGNAALREEVVRLLDADRVAEAEAFLDRRAIEDAAQLITLDLSERRARLSPGNRLGPYEITGPLGEGGMGEVYRARDLQLHRNVAIKVLSAALADDARYMDRFRQEAQVLASLNHPHIATVYGIEQGALVMELVEGDNLRGPLPLEEAIPIARQIAMGLEAAHERGIVHRDLKPGNIKITPEGVVKLLDFGLAKSSGVPAVAPHATPLGDVSPTNSLGGMVLGTAAYMSPEQALGKPVDKRADIWAFGVVFCEMLTGRRLFAYETTAETLAAVVRAAPDLENLPAGTPSQIRYLLGRCLRKDVASRLRDIGEARVLLDEALEPPAALPQSQSRRHAAWWVAAGATIAAGLFAWLWQQRPSGEAHRLQLTVPAPPAAAFSAISVPAVSPDGRYLAFTAAGTGKGQLWIRDLDALSAERVPESDGAVDPFWSPDSRFVAFFVPGKLKKVAASGGPVLTVCDAADGRGGSWNRSDEIVFGPNFAAPLFRVPAAGGKPTPLTVLDERAGETSHRFPWFLPDGRHFLYTARNADPEKTAVYAGDLESRDHRPLLKAASNAMYALPGFLLFMREKTLMAQPFDARSLKTTGDPSPVAEQVDYLPGSIQGQFSVSQTGVLVYNSGGGSLKSQITWFDRSGKALGTVGPPSVMQSPAISPDGSTVVVDRLDETSGTYALWLHDLVHQTGSRFTFDPSNHMFPIWSPDGNLILFSSNRTGEFSLYQKAASGAEKESLLFKAEGQTVPTDWSPSSVLFSNVAVSTGTDLWSLPATGKAAPVLRTRYAEAHGRLSPDGRWLAYDSDESGQLEVYVQTFPGAEGKWQISPAGGTRPVWSRSGNELFYVSADNKLTSVSVQTGDRFAKGVPRPLFDVHMPPTGTYDVSRDGSRFLILKGIDPEVAAPITVVVNWNAAGRRR